MGVGSANKVVITRPGDDYTAVSGTTSLTIQIQDVGGNLITTDNATSVTFSVAASSCRINGVTTGTGDGSYGVPGGSEAVTVTGGIATITMIDSSVETYSVTLTNDSFLTNPAPDSITVFPAKKIEFTAIDGGLRHSCALGSRFDVVRGFQGFPQMNSGFNLCLTA